MNWKDQNYTVQLQICLFTIKYGVKVFSPNKLNYSKAFINKIIIQTHNGNPNLKIINSICNNLKITI